MAKAQPGNDNAKIGLLVGAIVLIIGYLGFSMVKRMGGEAPAPPPTVAPVIPIQGTADDRIRADTPIVSIFDPTVNPFRTTVKTDADKGSSGAKTAKTTKGDTTSGAPPWNSDLPGVGEGIGELAPMPVAVPPTKLSGVIVDENSIALVVIGDKSELLSIGDLIPGGFRIVSIDGDGIEVRKGAKVYRILIGQTFTGDPVEKAVPPPSVMPSIEAVPH